MVLFPISSSLVTERILCVCVFKCFTSLRRYRLGMPFLFHTVATTISLLGQMWVASPKDTKINSRESQWDKKGQCLTLKSFSWPRCLIFIKHWVVDIRANLFIMSLDTETDRRDSYCVLFKMAVIDFTYVFMSIVRIGPCLNLTSTGKCVGNMTTGDVQASSIPASSLPVPTPIPDCTLFSFIIQNSMSSPTSAYSVASVLRAGCEEELQDPCFCGVYGLPAQIHLSLLAFPKFLRAYFS